MKVTISGVPYEVPAMLPPGTWATNGAILHGVAHLKRRGFFLGYVGDWRSPDGLPEKSDIKWVDQIDKDRPAEPERVGAPNAPDYVPGGKAVFPNGPGTAWLQHGTPPPPRDEDLPHYDGSITPESETMRRYEGKPWSAQLSLVVDRYVAWQSTKYSGMGPSPFWELIALAERLEAGLAEARATLEAWQPTVCAAIGWRHPGPFPPPSSAEYPATVLERAVDALPAAKRPK